MRAPFTLGGFSIPVGPFMVQAFAVALPSLAVTLHTLAVMFPVHPLAFLAVPIAFPGLALPVLAFALLALPVLAFALHPFAVRTLELPSLPIAFTVVLLGLAPTIPVFPIGSRGQYGSEPEQNRGDYNQVPHNMLLAWLLLGRMGARFNSI
jgi:hypothetical protein